MEEAYPAQSERRHRLDGSEVKGPIRWICRTASVNDCQRSERGSSYCFRTEAVFAVFLAVRHTQGSHRLDADERLSASI